MFQWRRLWSVMWLLRLMLSGMLLVRQWFRLLRWHMRLVRVLSLLLLLWRVRPRLKRQLLHLHQQILYLQL